MPRGKLPKHSPPSTAIIPRVSMRRTIAAEQIVGTAPRSGRMFRSQTSMRRLRKTPK
jgi:hypothetical protein